MEAVIPAPMKRVRSTETPLAMGDNEDTVMKNAAKRDRPGEPHVEGSTKKAKMGEGDCPTRAVNSKKVLPRKVDYVHAENDVRLDA